jgi:hypothetical protein
VVAELTHRLGLAPHTGEAGLVEALGLDQRDRDLASQARVAGEEDALLGALAEEALDLVAPAGEARRRRPRRRRCGGRPCGARLPARAGARTGTGERGAAVAAEALAGLVAAAAGRAGEGQRRAALGAEAAPDAVRVLAGGAARVRDRQTPSASGSARTRITT